MDDQHLIADPDQQKRGSGASSKSAGAAKPFEPANLVGRVLDGRYELIKCVGRGGMGVVYLAHQSALGRDVVVKLLPPNFADDADALARFQREARGMSKLQHPHIVSIYDFGIEDGQAYIVMEYVAGITLRRFVTEHQGPNGMSFETFGNIALQTIEGLGAAHAMGLVHRDIKPSNIMLTQRGSAQHYVKILDFGLAKLLKGAQDITRDQGLVGSVGYLSPEQILGHPTDERVDIYALGVLFYYMLCGEKPFLGEEDVAVLYKHVHQAPKPLEHRVKLEQRIPFSTIELVHRMLSKTPDDRPANARALLHEFGKCLEGTSVQSLHVSGEFRAVSRPIERGGPFHDDPSSELASDRVRRETPFSQVPAHSTSTHSGVISTGSGTFTSSPASGSWVSGEHLLKVEQQNRTRNILLAILGLLILGAAVAFLLQNNQSQTDGHNAAEEIAVSPAAESPGSASEDKRSAAVAPVKEEEVEAGATVGRLEVSARPNAAIFIDDRALGQSPISTDIEVGSHRLELRKKGWTTIRREIKIDAENPLRFEFEMEKTSRSIGAESPTAAAPKAQPKPRPNSPKQRPTRADKKPATQPEPAKESRPTPAAPQEAVAQEEGDDLLPTTIPDDDDDLLMD